MRAVLDGRNDTTKSVGTIGKGVRSKWGPVHNVRSYVGQNLSAEKTFLKKYPEKMLRHCCFGPKSFVSKEKKHIHNSRKEPRHSRLTPLL
jgi:hypothetical protein